MAERTQILPGNPPCVVYHRHAVVNGVRLHYVDTAAHPAAVKGRATLCCALHGFPEFWYSWRHQLPALAAAGFRVLAPDLRGYNASAKPHRVADYRVECLADDVAGLIAHAGERDAVVVGHDWGGGIAWYLPMRHPRLIRRLIVLNAPHPAVFVRELQTPAQLLRSWYMFFFQLPGLPESAFRAGNFRSLERTLRTEPVRPGAFTDEDIRLYKRALSRPGALTAAINYYRAAFLRLHSLGRQVRPITVPTLLIWGERDRYLGLRNTEGLEPWVPNLRLARLPNASHWIQNDAPEEVNRLMVEFLLQQ
jgi:pimeloyl-ACP methyl ester carboxylesterase